MPAEPRNSAPIATSNAPRVRDWGDDDLTPTEPDPAPPWPLGAALLIGAGLRLYLDWVLTRWLIGPFEPTFDNQLRAAVFSPLVVSWLADSLFLTLGGANLAAQSEAVRRQTRWVPWRVLSYSAVTALAARFLCCGLT